MNCPLLVGLAAGNDFKDRLNLSECVILSWTSQLTICDYIFKLACKQLLWSQILIGFHDNI